MVLSKKRARKVIEEIIALYPDAKPSLDFHNHFELLCAVLLSAQTTDAAVNKATPGLFAAFPTPQAMAAANVEDIEPFISRLGLYRNKAKFLKECAQQLVDCHDGIVPQTREELEALAGVGRKTANVILSVLYQVPAIAVDTHVFRVANRLRLGTGDTPEAVEIALQKAIPKTDWAAAHHWLIWHGRKICKARKPLCKDCPVQDLCPSMQP